MGGRALLVHFHFPPDGLVGSQITAKFAKYLPAFGWEPWVLTAAERYYPRLDPSTLADVSRWDRVRRTRRIQHPRFGYLALKALVGRWGGRGTPRRRGAGLVPPARRSATLRTAGDLFSVPDDVVGWLPIAAVAGLRVIRRERIDRLFSSGPPWTNHLVAAVLCRVTRVPWAACFEDPWAEIAARQRAPLAARVHARLERLVVTSAAAVICLTEHHRRAMVRRFPGVGPGRFVTIPNGWDADDFPPRAPLPAGPFTVTLTGTLYAGQTPRQFFMAVRRLLDAGDVDPEELRVQLIGHCDSVDGVSVRAMVAEEGLERVVGVRPFVPRDEAMRLMQASHLLLVLAHDYVLQVPSKTYQYFRIGRPVLALAPEGATADVVRASGAGTVVDPYDVPAIAEALAAFVRRHRRGEALGGADRNFVARFERRRLTSELARVLDRLGGDSAGTLEPLLDARSA